MTLKYYLSFKFTFYMSEINSKILDCTHYIWIAKCRNRLSDTKEICKIWNIKVKKFPVFYRTGRYIPVFITAHCRSLSWSRWIQIKSSRATNRVKWLSEENSQRFEDHPIHTLHIALRSNFIWSSHLRLGFLSDSFLLLCYNTVLERTLSASHTGGFLILFRAPLDEGSAHRRGLYLNKITQHKETGKHLRSKQNSNPRSQRPTNQTLRLRLHGHWVRPR
jgi:hypothetical protein